MIEFRNTPSSDSLPSEDGSGFGCNRDTAKAIGFNACRTFFVNFASYVAGGFAGTGVSAYLEPYCGKSWASAVGAMVNYMTRYTVQYAGGIGGDGVQACLGLKSVRFTNRETQQCADVSSFVWGTTCGMASTALGLYVGVPLIKGSNEQSTFGSFGMAASDAIASMGADLLSPCWGPTLRAPSGCSSRDSRKIALALVKGVLAAGMAESINMTGMSPHSKSFLSSLVVYLDEGVCDFGTKSFDSMRAERRLSRISEEAAESERKVHVA
jgi:hypothetical protein